MDNLKKTDVQKMQQPDWAKGAILYQMIIDRFYKSPSHHKNLIKGRIYRNKWNDEEVTWQANEHGLFHNNDFFCGDLQGIIKKLPYLSKLGVSVLYLSPINYSKYRYDRYAATDHKMIDPDAGNFTDLKNLHDEAKKNGMHIILDVAFNHCCTDNPIFVDAFSNPNSKYYDWFRRDEEKNIKLWYNFRDMPEFNQSSVGYQNYVYGDGGIIDTYSPYVDGFRLDLAEILEPSFLEGIRNCANKKSPHFILGEFWHDAPNDYFGKSLDSVTAYPISNAILKFLVFNEADYLISIVKNYQKMYPQSVLDSLIVSLDTHDTIRALTMLGKKQYMMRGLRDIWDIDKEPSPWHKDGTFDTYDFRKFEFDNDSLSPEEYKEAKKLLKLGVILQYFLLGSPCIYYGTEVGLYGFKDPFSRKPFPWNHMDTELLKYYRGIGKFRASLNLNGAKTEIVSYDSESLVFVRHSVNSVLVAVNNGNSSRVITIPDEFKAGKMFSFNVNGNAILLPYGALVIAI